MTWILASRIVRARWVRRGALPSCVVAALLVTVAMVMSAVSLTAEQRREEQFGGYALEWQLPQPAFLGEPMSVPDGAEARGPLLVRSDRLTALTGDRLMYLEGPWAESEPPGRYDLTSGRWPQEPGEVVITQALVGGDQVLAVSPDIGDLTVVGEIDNAYSSSAEVLAAPGTWAAATVADADSPTVPEATVSVFTGRLEPAEAAELASMWKVTEPLARDAPDETVSWSDRSPMAFRIPLLLLPILVGAFAALFGRRRLVRTSAALMAVGTPRHHALSALALAGGGALAIGAVLGSLIGTVLGFCGGLLAAQAAGHPHVLSLPGPLVYGAVTVPSGIGWAALVLALQPDRHRAPRLPGVIAGVGQRAKHLATWALGAVALGLAVTVHTPAQSMILMVCLVGLFSTLMPQVLKLVSSWIPAHDPATRWGLCSLRAPGGAALGSLFLLLALITPALASLALASMSSSQMRSEALAAVGPGQVGVLGLGGAATPPPPSASAAADAALDGRPRRQLLWVDGFLPFDGPYLNASVLVVEDATDAPLILGDAITPAEVALLREGGLVHWGSGSPESVSVEGVVFTAVRRTVGISEEWSFQAGAVITRETALAAQLPLLEGGLLYSEVGPADVTRLMEDVDARGIDRRLVEVYHPPEPPVGVLAAVVSAGVLCLVVVMVATAAASARVAGLRPVVTQLVTHGASRRQVRRMVAIEPLATTAAAFAIGVGSVAIGVGVLMMRVPFLTIDMKAWPALVVALVVAVCAGQAVGVLVAIRGARPGYAST